jgi:hypothetical protein
VNRTIPARDSGAEDKQGEDYSLMIVGHLAFASIAKRTFFKSENFPFLIIASYAPDIVDKTASMVFGCPGRNVGHSLLLFLGVFTAGWLLSQLFAVSQDMVVAAAVMWASHLIGDFVRPTVLLWPLFGPIAGDPFHAAGALYRMYVALCWPGQLTLEICLVTLALLPLPVLERVLALVRVRQFRSEKSTHS